MQQCRDLGPNCDTGGPCRRLLAVDYTIDCESPEFIGYSITMLPALLALWPIGLPLMVRQRSSPSFLPSVRHFGAANESFCLQLFMKMYKVRKLILEGDEDTLKQYGFVLDDYKTNPLVSLHHKLGAHRSLDYSKRFATC